MQTCRARLCPWWTFPAWGGIFSEDCVLSEGQPSRAGGPVLKSTGWGHPPGQSYLENLFNPQRSGFRKLEGQEVPWPLLFLPALLHIQWRPEAPSTWEDDDEGGGLFSLVVCIY